MSYTEAPTLPQIVLAEMKSIDTDLLQDMLAAETNPPLAWLIQVELNRRVKQTRPWWYQMDEFADMKDN